MHQIMAYEYMAIVSILTVTRDFQTLVGYVFIIPVKSEASSSYKPQLIYLAYPLYLLCPKEHTHKKQNT